MAEKRTGRPPKYTEAQVMEGVELVERDGNVPTGDSVKKVMCAHLGVAGGINAQSLDKEVERLLAERDRIRRDRRIAALPNSTTEAARQIAQLVEAAVLDHLGSEHESLRAFAGKKLADLSADLTTQREQIRALLGKIDAKDDEIAGLELEKAEISERLSMAELEVAALKEAAVHHQRENDFRSEVMALMKDALGAQTTREEMPVEK